MARNNRAELFEKTQPKISDADLVRAAKARRIVTSWNARPAVDENGRIISLGLKLALGKGKQETVLFERFSAWMLMELLQAIEKADWTKDYIAPIGQKPN